MLPLQEFLSNYITVEEKITALQNEFSVRVTNDKLVNPNFYSLNYSQLDSPKAHPVVRNCRSIIVDLTNNEIIARSFDRFYNFGECQKEVIFDESQITVHEKIDGAIFLFYEYNGTWYPASRKTTSARNSLMKYNDEAIPMLQIVSEFFGINHSWVLTEEDGSLGLWIDIDNYNQWIEKLQEHFVKFDKTKTYVCELVSKYNKVVTEFKESDIYILGSVDPKSGANTNCPIARRVFNIPFNTVVDSISEVYDVIAGIQRTSPYFVEGVVITDKNGTMAKVKSPAYVAAHLANGSTPTHNSIVKVVSAFEEDEYLCYFPEHKEVFKPYIEERKVFTESINVALQEASDMQKQGLSNKEISMHIKAKYPSVLNVVMRSINTGEKVEINATLISKIFK